MAARADSPSPLALSLELEALLVRRLRDEWIQINWALFGDAMRMPGFELSEATETLGVWRPQTRTIALSREAVLSRPWAETIETIKHEAAHQFVHEILGADESPHGSHFRRVCLARGIDPRATASPSTKPTESTPQDRIVARVQKLLALAQSANQHEAELAASTAQRLMLKYNVDLQRDETATRSPCSHLWLGTPTGRIPGHHKQLASLLSKHFFVTVIWISVYRPAEGKRGSVLEVCGRPENLAMAEYVHAFVLRAVDRLWLAHKREQGLRSNRDRRSFLEGAVAGFDAKLAAQSTRAQQEGLVWVGDAAVEDYFARRHPRTTSTSRIIRGSASAYAEGKSAGRNLVLSRPVTAESSRRVQRALRAAD